MHTKFLCYKSNIFLLMVSHFELSALGGAMVAVDPFQGHNQDFVLGLFPRHRASRRPSD